MDTTTITPTTATTTNSPPTTITTTIATITTIITTKSTLKSNFDEIQAKERRPHNELC